MAAPARPLLQVSLDDASGHPAMDTAISRVLLERVDRGELPASLRLSRPPAVVAFSSRDARTAGFDDAVLAARRAGFAPLIRLAGGRPAVFTPDTIAFAWSVPTESPSEEITARFKTLSGRLVAAFRSLGVDAHLGEVPGEYCPGEYSVHAVATSGPLGAAGGRPAAAGGRPGAAGGRPGAAGGRPGAAGGRRKVAGVGQRLLRRAAHTGGVVVVDEPQAINDVLLPVYEALGLAFDPAATGALAEHVSTDVDEVRQRIVSAFAETFEVVPWRLDERTIELARESLDHHLPAEPVVG